MKQGTNELRTNEIVAITKLDKAPDGYPKFSYSAEYFGQAYYISEQCKIKGIRASNIGNVIYIYSRKKLPNFIEIVRESYSYIKKPFPLLEGNVVSIQLDKALLCVYLLSKDTVYVTEGHLPYLVYEIFKRNLPRPKNFCVCTTKRELMDTLLMEENILI